MKKVLEFIKNHRVQILVFLVALLVLFLRRTDAILNAQLWAEDGRDWLGDAYNGGYSLLTLLDPYAGYLVLVQRGVALLSGLFPLEYTPLFFNACALLIQALPLVFLWSKRTNYVGTKLKVFITIAYLLLPFTAEVHANVTNSQWFLAMTLFLLLFIKEAKSKVMRYIEYMIVAVASLSGPFSILLTPIIATELYRTRALSLKSKIVLVGAAIQLILVLMLHKTPEQEYIGLSITQLFNIIGGQIFGSSLFGQESIGALVEKSWATPLLAVLGLELLVYVFIKSRNTVLRYFIVFSALTVVTALVSPNGSTPYMSWWESLTVEGKAGRYYVFIRLAIYICLGWLALSRLNKNTYLRIVAILVLSVSIVGMSKDFSHPRYVDFKYKQHIQQYNSSTSGETTIIPLNPGEPWVIELRK